MTIIARALAAAVLAATMLPAQAGHPPDCPRGQWQATWQLQFRQCNIGFAGFPIIFFGDSSANGGAWVHAWITVPTPDGPKTLAECRGTGTTYASCDGAIGSTGRVIDLVPTEATITCWIEGKTGGWFSCRSGSGLQR